MFSNGTYSYPEVVEDEIDTVQFLEASKGIVKFVEVLGTAFIPVKSDIQGNIEKLYNVYHTDESRFKTLNGIIDYELNADVDKVGIDALLWLKRALQYVNIFLTCIIEDYQNGEKTENMSPFFHKAYEESLQMHHSWLIQNLFKVIVMCAPSRKTLLFTLANQDEEISEEDLFQDIEKFVDGLNKNLAVINNMYLKYNLDSGV